jgi:hypothetical protein
MSAAPWAKKAPLQPPQQPQPPQHFGPHKRKAGLGGGLGGGGTMVEGSEDAERGGGDDDEEARGVGAGRVAAYLAACRPDEDAEAAQSARGWVAAQAEASPTLLPHLKFHDLVFGHELGRGSFSVVKYARQILKGAGSDASGGGGDPSSDGGGGLAASLAAAAKAKAQRAAVAQRGRSVWPEFAVKIVATEKIVAHGYAKNLVREIALLRTLSHPGIARMVSVFKWRDGCYLVLEYASGGDLHGLVTRSGSLDLASTQFVLGEATAALCSVRRKPLHCFSPDLVIAPQPACSREAK